MSAALTPYKALTIAVQNEERGFAFYSYIAAHIEDAGGGRNAAEQLAREELRHAALLRRERRRAWRREREARPSPWMASDLLERAHQMVERQAAALHIGDIGLVFTRRRGRRGGAVGRRPRGAERRRGTRFRRRQYAEDTTARRLDEQGRADLLRTALAEAERVDHAYADAVDYPATRPTCSPHRTAPRAPSITSA